MDLSGSKGRIKSNNGPDVTVEKLLRGNQKVVTEEEIVRNAKTHQQKDNGVLEILSNQKPVLSVILCLNVKCTSRRKKFYCTVFK